MNTEFLVIEGLMLGVTTACGVVFWFQDRRATRTRRRAQEGRPGGPGK